MPIPKYHEIQKPILEVLSDGQAYRYRDLEPLLAPYFQLSTEERQQEYQSGNGLVFLDRISWALSYLHMGGLLEKPQRAQYQITALGKQFLNKSDQAIRQYINEQRLQKQTGQSGDLQSNPKAQESITDATPEEALSQGFEELKASTCQDILDTILSKHPQAFEELVVKLLQKMGYGGAIKDAGEVTQYSNDGGIDGIIREDVLGFGRIHLQAKRYARDKKIGRVDIQSFVGAMAAAKADKGIFITTSSFTQEAHQYVRNLSNAMRLLLMDGDELANYIYDYGLGMSIDRVIEIKKLDSDFWETMANE